MCAVMQLILGYFDWNYSSDKLDAFLGLTEPPPPVTRKDYARVPHFIPPSRYKVVNRRERPEPLRPVKSQEVIKQLEDWQRRDIHARKYKQDLSFTPSDNISESRLHRDQAHSPKSLPVQLANKTV